MELKEQKSKLWIMEKGGAAHFIDPKNGICACGWKPHISNLQRMEQVDPKAVLFLGHKVCTNCAYSINFSYAVKERIQFEKQLRDPKKIKIESLYKVFIENLIIVTRLQREGWLER